MLRLALIVPALPRRSDRQWPVTRRRAPITTLILTARFLALARCGWPIVVTLLLTTAMRRKTVAPSARQSRQSSMEAPFRWSSAAMIPYQFQYLALLQD